LTDGVPLGSFLGGTSWNPHQNDASGVPLVGALPMIAGSFAVTLLSCALALPFALGASLFVVDVAPSFGRRVFRPMIELLVGIPSVVFGLVGTLGRGPMDEDPGREARATASCRAPSCLRS